MYAQAPVPPLVRTPRPAPPSPPAPRPKPRRTSRLLAWLAPSPGRSQTDHPALDHRQRGGDMPLELPNAPGESVTSSGRFFPATILGGHLHVRGIPDWGPWNPSRLEWADEAFVDMLLSKDQADRKARTREEPRGDHERTEEGAYPRGLDAREPSGRGPPAVEADGR